jgi:hypothetical protein
MIVMFASGVKNCQSEYTNGNFLLYKLKISKRLKLN